MFGNENCVSTQSAFFTGSFWIFYVIIMKNLIPDDLPIIKSEPRKKNGDSLIDYWLLMSSVQRRMCCLKKVVVQTSVQNESKILIA